MIYLPNAVSPPSPNAETRSSGKRGAASAKTGHMKSRRAERQNKRFSMPARALGLSQVKKSILVDSARSVLGEGPVRVLTNFDF